jgi:hypothetical protein
MDSAVLARAAARDGFFFSTPLVARVGDFRAGIFDPIEVTKLPICHLLAS